MISKRWAGLIVLLSSPGCASLLGVPADAVTMADLQEYGSDLMTGAISGGGGIIGAAFFAYHKFRNRVHRRLDAEREREILAERARAAGLDAEPPESTEAAREPLCGPRG